MVSNEGLSSGGHPQHDVLGVGGTRGGFDVQNLLPRGQVEDIRKGVHDVMKNLGAGGGYIFSPSHYILADVPIQNIYTLLEAQREFGTYGKYPLN